MRTFSTIGITLSAAMFLACGGVPQAKQGSGPPAADSKADEATQAERGKILQKFMVAGGPVEKVQDGELWVRPAFYLLTFEDKKTVATLAWAYSFAVPNTDTAESSGILLIHDVHTGKQIGKYSRTGFSMD